MSETKERQELHCPKCRSHRGGDVLGAKCQSVGCDGTIEVMPSYHSLIDVLPEPMTCGRRASYEPKGQDRWHKFKAIDNRVCSYCGSLHPDDMFRLTKEAATTADDVSYHDAVRIEPSDKGYKIYVHQPKVVNAHDGGIKFYTQHLPRNEAGEIFATPEQDADFEMAVLKTRARFNLWSQAAFPDKTVH